MTLANASAAELPRQHPLTGVIAQLRLHQWTKNLLLFVPLTMAHRLNDPGRVLHTLLAFGAFCASASAAYTINDLVDLRHDRVHPRKSARPLASGALRVPTAHVLWVTLLIAAAALAFPVGRDFMLLTAGYVIATIIYSLFLKSVLLIDVILLASLYTLRIVGGGVAADVLVSQWLLTFATFFFLSLALLKRYAETAELETRGAATPGRAYVANDAPILRSFGIACGIVSILVFALYLNSEHVLTLYRHPEILWIACPLLFYAIARMWLLADRGVVHDDPVVFAARDPATYAIVAVLALVIYAAI